MRRRPLSSLMLLALSACGDDRTAVDAEGPATLGDEASSSDDGSDTAGTDESGDTGETSSDSTGEAPVCACAPGTDLIYL
ncbi:MAG: hypothetical protein KC457_26610, partial [Myxococcales bacterium]|nr:hypothetical protein [Myxococcales bacterium]